MTTYFVSNAGSNTAPYDTEAKAATTLAVIAALPWLATDVVKLSSTHTETAAAAITYAFPSTAGLQLLSVTFNGAGTGGLAAGAAINVGAANAAFQLTGGFVEAYGISFVAGTNANTACDLTIGGSNNVAAQHYRNCTFSAPSTTTSAQIFLGPNASATSAGAILQFDDCTFSNGAIKSILIQNGRILINNMTLAGTAATTVFSFSASTFGDFILTASDLDNLAWTNLFGVGSAATNRALVYQCILRSGFSLTTGTFAGPTSAEIVMIDCDSGDNHYTYIKAGWAGTVVASSAVYLDASDGVTPISWLMTGNANTSFTWPLVSPAIATFNATLSAMTSTVEAINDGTTFTDKELWQETLAKITSGFTLGTWNIGDRAADILAAGANQASSTATWGAGPGGTEVKQKLVSTSFTPAEVGVISTVVKLAKNDNVYVSPEPLLG